ncbi:hypothetical protein N7530_008422 [Penicillium desertorum]|uniref:Uncharacterized protein n=1 Tax=Penicillium desertorum TaxID=1303715 RepID=A0A9X0BKW3_9EURO|nr:hypothetical protein N7530_008422 [Penicillium desertorum]
MQSCGDACMSESPGQPSRRGAVSTSESGLPEMVISVSEYTISSAIHKIDFVGRLVPWPNVGLDVGQFLSGQASVCSHCCSPAYKQIKKDYLPFQFLTPAPPHTSFPIHFASSPGLFAASWPVKLLLGDLPRKPLSLALRRVLARLGPSDAARLTFLGTDSPINHAHDASTRQPQYLVNLQRAGRSTWSLDDALAGIHPGVSYQTYLGAKS